MFDPAILRRAVGDSIRKLNPRLMARNPVMFVVEIGSVLTTLLFFRDLRTASTADNVFVGLVSAWLWFTVLFAKFDDAAGRVGDRGHRPVARVGHPRRVPSGHPGVGWGPLLRDRRHPGPLRPR